MIESTAGDIVRVASGTLVAGSENSSFKGIAIDSRSLVGGELFFCIRGKQFDGHNFIGQAMKKKVAGLVLSRLEKFPGFLSDSECVPFVVLVNDVLIALQKFATRHRRRVNPCVIAITGTNGKSSTKEMTASIMATRYPTLKTQGNFNNHIGLPLTLFNLEAKHEMAVLEMGISAIGEMRRLAEIAEPDIGVITNISEAHLLSLKNIKEVQAAKGELFESLSPQGTAIVNADDPLVLELAQSARSKIITYAIHNSADIRAGNILAKGNTGYDFELSMFGQETNFFLPCLGLFNIYNALAAVATGHSLGIPFENMNKGLRNSRLPAQRMEISRFRNLTIINDSYNANPESMRKALRALSGYQTSGQRFFVIGDMLELADTAQSAHRRLGMEVAESNIDFLVTLGDLSRLVGKEAVEAGMNPANIVDCETHEQAAESLNELTAPGDCLLFKGSRGSKMENVIEALMLQGDR